MGLSWLLRPEIRIEELLDGDRYVIRAELPGVDPAEDVRIGLAEGELRLQVDRKDEHTEKGHSEFRYGTFHRTIPLPGDTKQDTLTAKYADGILEISALVGEPAAAMKSIPITVGPAEKA